MPKRMRDTLVALAATGALVGGTAVVAQAATSTGSSTTKAPAATPKPATPPAHGKGSNPCPNMGGSGSGSPGASYAPGSPGMPTGT
jgi:hypothetical protein